MTRHVPAFPCLVLAAVLMLAEGPGLAQVVEPAPGVQEACARMLTALQNNDRAAFLVNSTEEVKPLFPAKTIEDLSRGIGARLKSGYHATYLGQLNQGPVVAYLWKLTFKDGGADLAIRALFNKEGKFNGFFIF